jgi:signal transduction histidine kinase
MKLGVPCIPKEIPRVISLAYSWQGIWAENNLDGKGATFTFSLPLSMVH